MAYSTEADLKNRFGISEIDQLIAQGSNLAAIIADADAKINTFLRGRYVTPIVTPPSEIVQASCDISRYFLYDDSAPEEVRLRYEDLLKWLAQIAKGLVTLDAPSKIADTDVGGGGVVIASRSQVYTDKLTDKMITPLTDLGL